MKYTKLLIGVLAVSLILGSALLRQPVSAQDEEGIHVITTIYPVYDWILSTLGDNPGDITVEYLLDTGTDLHSFQPTVDDIMHIASCDLFVYVGGESDSWVRDALSTARSEDLHTLCLLDELGDAALEEEMVEGMQEEEEEGEEESTPDEHIWLSLRNASTCITSLCDALSQLDEEHADTYAANAAAYKEKLSALDEAYAKVVEAGSYDTLLFGDRFPFRYLVEDYGLTYYAAFAGCSAETEASFETIIFLAKKVDELNLPCIMTIEGSDQKVAQTIQRSTQEGNQKILSLDSMQSASSAQKDGYLSIMEENLATLKEALQ